MARHLHFSYEPNEILEELKTKNFKILSVKYKHKKYTYTVCQL